MLPIASTRILWIDHCGDSDDHDEGSFIWNILILLILLKSQYEFSSGSCICTPYIQREIWFQYFTFGILMHIQIKTHDM